MTKKPFFPPPPFPPPPPQEWGASCPHQFIAGYKLQHDMSWTPLAQVETKDAELAIMSKLISRQTALPACVEPNFEGIGN